MTEKDPYPARCPETDEDGNRCLRSRRHPQSRLARERLHDFGRGAVGLDTLGGSRPDLGPVIT